MEQINLNLIPGRAMPVCHVSQYDVDRTIRCNLFEGDTVFALATGDTAEVHVRKPDDTVVTASLTVVNAQTYLDIKTTQQMDAVAGSNLCEIQLTRSGATLGTLNFIMEVEADPMDGGAIGSQSEIRDLQAQVNAAVSTSSYVYQFFNNSSYSPQNPFSLADMPRMSYTYAAPATKFAELPAGIDSANLITIIKKPQNSAGNVSLVLLYNRSKNDLYYTSFIEGVGIDSYGWIKNADIDDINALASEVAFIKATTTKNSRNLFNKNDAKLVNGYFGNPDTTIKSSSVTRTLWIPCSPNTTYTISRSLGYYAYAIGTTTTTPATGVAITKPSLLIVARDGKANLTITTDSSAAFLCVYYYNGNHDSSDKLLGYLEDMMIHEGNDIMPYRDYIASNVKYREMLPVNTYGIFGISFSRNVQVPGVERVFDAEGMIYRQEIEGEVAHSDFDKAFPWCDMRVCNVSVDANGKKTIIYKGATAFSSSNDTFVEVPAFYFKRTEINDRETWMISGRPFSGAEIEPWFLNQDGSIEPYRYIARYEGAPTSSGKASVAGVIPANASGLTAFRNHVEGLNFKLMSIEAHLAISHLMTIEYGDMNAQRYNSGVSYLPYSMNNSTWNIAQNSATGNTVELPYNANLAYVIPGDTIYLSESDAHSIANPRTVTSITVVVNSKITIVFDGDPYTITAGTTRCYPAMQKTGRTDSMTYYNGRPDDSVMNCPFQYRGIENPFGNIWEFAPGGYWKKGTEKFTIGTLETDFTAPYQPVTGNDQNSQGFIKKLGYDRKMQWATLPETVGGTASTYIPDEWNTADSAAGDDDQQIFVIGGGWDHQGENGPYTLRCFRGSTSWLYGYRAMI